MSLFDFKAITRGIRSVFNKEAVGPDSDIAFFNALPMLPNPDPILRAMGVADRVYASIKADAHVIGEIRAIRGAFRAMDYRVVAGDENNAQSKAARDLCEDWMQQVNPNEVAGWWEVMWQMTSSILTGYIPHELVWDSVDGHVWPIEVADRPNRRIGFTVEGVPLVISREHPLGAPVEPYRLVISRHMASMTNPYGTALLSSCFWPWSFKTGGFKYFVRYCERHGLPWPIGRYPAGTQEKDQNDLGKALENMIDSGYAVVQEGNGVELLVPKASGSDLPQEALIDACNREMSKALTSQAMVGELQGVGARAASEIAHQRSAEVHAFDRDIAAQSMSMIFKWITLANFGPGVAPPELEFFKAEAAGKERAETYAVATRLGAKPSRAALLEELNIPVARDEADALVTYQGESANQAYSSHPAGRAFASEEAVATAQMTEELQQADLAAQAADAALEEAVLDPFVRMLSQYETAGKSLADVRAGLAELAAGMDLNELDDITRKALALSFVAGHADDGGTDAS